MNRQSESPEEEANEESWIPLAPPSNNQGASSAKLNPPRSASLPSVPNDQQHKRHTAALARLPSPPRYPSSSLPTATGNNNESLDEMRQRIETRIKLKSSFIDHPMNLFWKQYILNLAREIGSLDLHLRLGLALVLLGISTKLILLSTWYLWYPRLAGSALVVLASFVYWNWDQIANFQPDRVLEHLLTINNSFIKRTGALVLLFPTMLEMRTIGFLTRVLANSGWKWYTVMLQAILWGYLVVHPIVQQARAPSTPRAPPRERLYHGLVILFGFALLVSLVQLDLVSLPWLAAPFCTAAGTLLITYQDNDMEWPSRIIRHALRMTLRDVLSEMGAQVSQDELLQLAILRWIVDFWASSPSSGDNDTNPTNDGPAYHTGHSAPSAHETVGVSTTSPTGPYPDNEISNSTGAPFYDSPVVLHTASAPVRQSIPDSRASSFQQEEIQWDQLLPMLGIATSQMNSEAQGLRHGHNEWSSRNTDSASGPFDDLKDILFSLNVDERAEPIVRTYQRAVESFPPSRKVAVALSILRRCPAGLTLLWTGVFALSLGGHDLSLLVWLSTFYLLLPFCAVEYQRIYEWKRACVQLSDATRGASESVDTPPASTPASTAARVLPTVSSLLPTELLECDPMLLLLCGDVFRISQPPTLYLVWGNIKSSVDALLVGLTATRCVQTTAVAVQFAGNVMSLLELGHEVHRNGWLHGLVVLSKEVLLHTATTEAPGRTSATRHPGTKYTDAAVDAVNNAKIVARNVQTLSNDENFGQVLRPVLWTVGTLSGYGWMWGGEENNQVDASREGSEEVLLEPSTKEILSESTGSHQEEEHFHTSYSTSRPTKEKQTKLSGSSSKLMELVLAAYFQGAITNSEKIAFCREISELSETEDDNSTAIEELFRCLKDKVECEHERTETGAQIGEQPNAWLRLGMSTLSAVVGGLHVAGGRSSTDDSNTSRCASDCDDTDMRFANKPSTVEIVEIVGDEEEEDWVAVQD